LLAFRPVGVVSGGRRQAEDGCLSRGERVECFGEEAAERLPAASPGRHEACCAEPSDVPRHEWLGQPHLGDELGDGRFADGQAADDPEPVDVGQGLVDEAQLAEVLGWKDDVGDRAADVGAGGTQGQVSGRGRTVGSTAVYINGG